MYFVAEKAPYTLIVSPDDNAPDPRTSGYEDNLGKMILFHNRYNLGDKHDYTIEDAAALRKELERNGGVVLSVYGFEHGGFMISTVPFHDPWDSGQLGYIYASAEDIRREYGVNGEVGATLDDVRSIVENVLIGEVESYNEYLQGNVWGYQLYKDAFQIDSLYAVIGDVADVGEVVKQQCIDGIDATALDDLVHNLKWQSAKPDIRIIMWEREHGEAATSLADAARESREASAELRGDAVVKGGDAR